MKQMIAKTLIIALTMTSQFTYAHHNDNHTMVNSVLSGYAIETSNAISLISQNKNFDQLLNQINLLKKSNKLVAISSQSIQGDSTIYTIKFYNQKVNQDLSLVGTAVGSIIGGDEFTNSKPGIITFTKK